jgi:precorrin-2 dehydrogenase/sirohydrochlorin ferrochelatase
MANKLFPIFVKAEHLKILLVGGGNVGEEKLSAILANSPEATIDVVAGYIKPEVEKLAAGHAHVNLHYRDFENKDLDGKDLIFCATDNQALHQAIRQLCRLRHTLVNVADTPALCDFYLGSIVQKGDLKIGISTNGKSPTMAKRLREFLTDALPDDMQQILDQMQNIRDQIKGDFQEKIRVLNQVTSNWLSAGKEKQL